MLSTSSAKIGSAKMQADTEPALPDILMRRMLALDLDPDAVARTEPQLIRDLAQRCARCPSRDRCRQDLERGGADPAWESYCPAAILLDALTEMWWLHEQI